MSNQKLFVRVFNAAFSSNSCRRDSCSIFRCKSSFSKSQWEFMRLAGP